MERRPIHIIGVPLDLGQGRRGVDMGPSALRIAGLDQRIAALGHAVTDRGDLHVPIPETRSPGDPAKKYIREIARVCQRLHHAVLGSLRDGALPLVLGGDHSLGAGSVAAASDWAHAHARTIGLIWVDAHGDMNTPASSGSGNVHGMPLAALVGPEPQELARLSARVPAVDPARTVLLGIRDLDAGEKAHIRRSGVRVFTMSDIDRQGMASVAQQALAAAGAGTAGIHVSFDMDACDPAIAPGVGTAVRGGLGFREAHLLMEMVADSGLLTSLDLVEVNPILDVQNTTAALGMELALSALGQKIL
jgi:arginase